MDLSLFNTERCERCGKLKNINIANAAAAVPIGQYVVSQAAAGGAPQAFIPYEGARVNASATVSSSDLCWCGVTYQI